MPRLASVVLLLSLLASFAAAQPGVQSTLDERFDLVLTQLRTPFSAHSHARNCIAVLQEAPFRIVSGSLVAEWTAQSIATQRLMLRAGDLTRDGEQEVTGASPLAIELGATDVGQDGFWSAAIETRGAAALAVEQPVTLTLRLVLEDFTGALRQGTCASV